MCCKNPNYLNVSSCLHVNPVKVVSVKNLQAEAFLATVSEIVQAKQAPLDLQVQVQLFSWSCGCCAVTSKFDWLNMPGPGDAAENAASKFRGPQNLSCQSRRNLQVSKVGDSGNSQRKTRCYICLAMSTFTAAEFTFHQ